MAKMNFGGTEEEVITRDEFTLDKARQVLEQETVAVLGYGVQGPAQALNMKDNGINVIVGQAPDDKFYWDKAVNDGWVPGKTLFSIEEAVQTRHGYPISGVRCSADDLVAKSQSKFKRWRCPLFLAWIFDCL